MTDREKFTAFKEELVEENEKTYGTEVREKYGNEEMDAANRKMLNMSEEEWENFQSLGNEINDRLKKCVLTGIQPESEEGKQIAVIHKEWLCKTWKAYSPEAHKGLAYIYIADERFKSYYDREVSGCAEFLEQAIRYWADRI